MVTLIQLLDLMPGGQEIEILFKDIPIYKGFIEDYKDNQYWTYPIKLIYSNDDDSLVIAIK